MAGNLRFGTVVATFVACLPLLTAGVCGPPEGFGVVPPIADPEFDQNADGRTAYMSMNGALFVDPVTESGLESSDVGFDAANASLDTENDPIADMNEPFNGVGGGLFQSLGPTRIYGTPGGNRLEVMQVGDIDNDGASDDTFFVFTENQPAPGNLEVSMSYAGTRTDTAVIDNLIAAEDEITYSGPGEFVATFDNNFTTQQGDARIKVTFDGPNGAVDGQINNLTQIIGGAPPFAVNRLTFNGELDPGTPDYLLDNFAIGGGGTMRQLNGVEGVGSIFGPNAGGTAGVFGGSSNVGGTRINILGGFHGADR